jgi:hypothetical protein
VFKNNGGFAIHLDVQFLFVRTSALIKRLRPAHVTELLQVLIHDICRHDQVDDNLSKSLHVGSGLAQSKSKIGILRLHKEIPSNVNRVLFRNALLLVAHSQKTFFLLELLIRNTGMVHLFSEREQRLLVLALAMQTDLSVALHVHRESTQQASWQTV